MIDLIEVNIQKPIDRVASLHADPTNNTKWMHDIARVELVSGKPGAPGSRYRMIPSRGSMVFEATVVAAELPRELQLTLEASGITVLVRATFEARSDGSTRMRSEERFVFHGFVHRLMGLLARPAIRKAHRTHIEAFRQFAESVG
jgi:uncharacterized protein YndB with AHSA1/START domain